MQLNIIDDDEADIENVEEADVKELSPVEIRNEWNRLRKEYPDRYKGGRI